MTMTMTTESSPPDTPAGDALVGDDDNANVNVRRRSEARVTRKEASAGYTQQQLQQHASFSSLVGAPNQPPAASAKRPFKSSLGTAKHKIGAAFGSGKRKQLAAVQQQHQHEQLFHQVMLSSEQSSSSTSSSAAGESGGVGGTAEYVRIAEDIQRLVERMQKKYQEEAEYRLKLKQMEEQLMYSAGPGSSSTSQLGATSTTTSGPGPTAVQSGGTGTSDPTSTVTLADVRQAQQQVGKRMEQLMSAGLFLRHLKFVE